MTFIKSIWWCFIVCAMVLSARATPAPNNQATIVMFHRFGQTTHPSTNITMEQLPYFVSYMRENNFTVLPLTQVIHNVKNNIPLPEKTVVITIDDAYKSIYTHAYPVFKKAGFPFTVFLSSREVGGKNFLSWDNVKSMAKDNVDFQAHTHTHPYMTTLPIDENRAEIQKNITLIQKHTGIRPTIFAYPYGEANTPIINMVKNLGFTAGLSQYSGVFNSTSPLFYIPRFSMNERYGTADRIKLILNAQSFPITHITPQNPEITTNTPTTIKITVDKDITTLGNVSCFYNGKAKMQIQKSYPHITLSFDRAFGTGRHRINCTAPHPNNKGYRWFGMQYTVR